MKPVTLTPAAAADIDCIWEYTAENWGREQPNRYVGDLRRVIEKLATDSAVTQSGEYIREGYRKALAGRHVVFFREGADTVEVVRVLHQQMDVGRWV